MGYMYEARNQQLLFSSTPSFHRIPSGTGEALKRVKHILLNAKLDQDFCVVKENRNNGFDQQSIVLFTP